MAAVIFRGSTPTLRLSPTNGMSVSDLGTPTVAIYQAGAFFSYEPPDVTVDAANNCITVTIPEEDSILLTGGVDTFVQQCWYNDTTGNVIRFPTHPVVVEETIVHLVADQPEEVESEVE